MKSYTQSGMAYKAAPAGGGFVNYIKRSLSAPASNKGNYVKPTPFNYAVRSGHCAMGDLTFINGTAKGQYTNGALDNIPIPTNTNLSYVTLAYSSAVSNLYDQIRGSLDLSVDFAEASKSKDMILKALKVVEYARDFRREYARLPEKALGKKWLEYQYGWRPLVGSVYEAGKKIMSTDPDEHVMRIQARGSHTMVSNTWSKGQFAVYGILYHESYRTQLVVWLTPKASRIQSLAGYTSLNPVSIAWELMPYSFVVDWFINVGGYLRIAESALLYRDRFLSGCRTDTFRRNQVATPDSTGKTGIGDFVITDIVPCVHTYRTMSRTNLGSLPVLRVPVTSIDLGSQRMYSAAALLSQFLKRRIF